MAETFAHNVGPVFTAHNIPPRRWHLHQAGNRAFQWKAYPWFLFPPGASSKPFFQETNAGTASPIWVVS